MITTDPKQDKVLYGKHKLTRSAVLWFCEWLWERKKKVEGKILLNRAQCPLMFRACWLDFCEKNEFLALQDEFVETVLEAGIA